MQHCQSSIVTILLVVICQLAQGYSPDNGERWRDQADDDAIINDGFPLDDVPDVDQTDYSFAHPIFKRGVDMEAYFNPYIRKNKSSVREMRKRLDMGRLVLIPDAFDPEFAEAVFQELDKSVFTRDEHAGEDGFAYQHRNISNQGTPSAFLNQTHRIFSSPASKEFMSSLIDVDCRGKCETSATAHLPGDYSNPHSDRTVDRSLSFIWHLTKDDWRPEWGGSLYWCQENLDFAYLNPSFNTLILFIPKPTSQHFVTKVSPYATSKRLAYNGWYDSSWNLEPDADDDLLAKVLARVAKEQVGKRAVNGLSTEEAGDKDSSVQDVLTKLSRKLRPKPRLIFEIDANNPTSSNNLGPL